MKLHLIFNLNQMITADFLVDSAASSERSAIRTMLQAGVTYVLDRGYMAFDLLRDIIVAQAFVVMRAYNNIVVETVKDLPVTLPDSVAGHWIHVRDRIVQSSHPDAVGILFRLVECTVGTTTYRLITNRTDITTFQVIVLYAYRWQIELIFRFFKHTLNGVEVITQSKRGMDTFFAAMFLTAILQLYFKIDCLDQDGYFPPAQQDLPKQQGDKRAPNEIPESERDYYLERKYPSFGNLAPRDIASRAAKEACDDGRGIGASGRAGSDRRRACARGRSVHHHAGRTHCRRDARRRDGQ